MERLDRAERIVSLFIDEEKTYRQIANEVSLSAERVRQILKACLGESLKEINAMRLSDRKKAVATRKDKQRKEMLARRSPEARFFRKVRKTETCWVWTGALSSSGYGHFAVDGTHISAHRFSYELHKGPLTGGHIDHVCRVTYCVNPEHLEQVSAKENARRRDLVRERKERKFCRRGHQYGNKKNRYCSLCRKDRAVVVRGGEDKCLRGHERSKENTYVTPGGFRQCRVCNRARLKKYMTSRRKTAFDERHKIV